MLKRNLLKTILAFALTAALAVSVSAAVGDNLMTSASVVDCSGYANDEETPEFAIDGTFDTKWCHTSIAATEDSLLDYGDTLAWVTYDLGEEKYFNRYDIAHASLCKRDFGDTEYNTSEWALLVSDDLTSWTEVSRVTGNTAELSSHDIDLVSARYVRLVVIKGTQTDSPVARISELMIYESDENGAQSAAEAADILAELEEQERIADLEFRKSLIVPAIIYCSITAVAAAGVCVMIHFANKKKPSDNA